MFGLETKYRNMVDKVTRRCVTAKLISSKFKFNCLLLVEFKLRKSLNGGGDYHSLEEVVLCGYSFDNTTT